MRIFIDLYNFNETQQNHAKIHSSLNKEGSMKKGIVVFFLSIATMVATTSVVSADSDMGQKIFKKKFRKKCKFSGVKFARHHTQGEWETIWDNGAFPEEAKKICPSLNISDIKESWWEDVYDFSVEYASDGHIPKC